MTREETAAFVARREQLICRHDTEALMETHTDGCVLQSPWAGTVTGRDAIGRVYQAMFTAFPDLVYRVEELLIDGDRVAVVGMLTGTDLGGFMGMPPTQRPVKFPVVSLYTILGDQIAQERRIYDFTGLLVQIGTLKPKPG